MFVIGEAKAYLEMPHCVMHVKRNDSNIKALHTSFLCMWHPSSATNGSDISHMSTVTMDMLLSCQRILQTFTVMGFLYMML